MFLITPTLLNSFDYYFNFVAEDSEDADGNTITAESKELGVRNDFLRTLSREKSSPTEAMLAGINFEDRVQAYCRGADDESLAVREIGEQCKGGLWQQSVKREFGDYLLYGKLDVIKRDTIIDIKRTKSYDIGKYQKSMQHRIYMFCTGIPHFKYLISASNEREWYAEYYANHAGIEGEIKLSIGRLMSYLENDKEAKDLFYSKWLSLRSAAA